ncbi:MAG: hypothetical protein PHP07_01070 [Eubacteriales bacterium]|jgi:cell division protein FtsW (lipid II flippase)|nr:hypothetical protein [Eubacteriales bacterium]MDD3109495.1 hypothetical protein [Eubacteriales bacterium]MDD3571528.1 hypothetical protein [Eubacteriales bacterium]MDD4134453.1 hypothetical protein [Eubacteriales bacterium]
MSDFIIGLIVTGLGLAGVFLVLGLFFSTIKLLQYLEPQHKSE